LARAKQRDGTKRNAIRPYVQLITLIENINWPGPSDQSNATVGVAHGALVLAQSPRCAVIDCQFSARLETVMKFAVGPRIGPRAFLPESPTSGVMSAGVRDGVEYH